MLSLDLMDISGERQSDITHNIVKTRLNPDGHEISSEKVNQLKGDAHRAAEVQDPNYCGSCYGASPPANGCCNTCEDVQQAYSRQGWSFSDPTGIEQCVKEGWAEKMEEQSHEGCRINGRVKVNKVVGNVQFSHGSAFMRQGANVHDLLPYLKGKAHHDFGHIIHRWHFAPDHSDVLRAQLDSRELAFRNKLEIIDPLSNTQKHNKDGELNETCL